MEKGYVQVYTGNGKGKTTAVIGLSVRAAGAGLNVYIAQFMKQGDYSELKALARFDDRITIEQFGTGKFTLGHPTDEDCAAGQRGLDAVKKALDSGQYDVVVMEEGAMTEKFGIISTEDILKMIQNKPDQTELIITGRGASDKLIAAADLVTEMKEIKHYYQAGVPARRGIEH